MDDKFIVKIADFSLTRLPNFSSVYLSNRDVRSRSRLDCTLIRFLLIKFQYQDITPVQITAPEAIEQNIYSEKSDVFSFGILLIHLFNSSSYQSDEILKVRNRNIESIKKPKFADEETLVFFPRVAWCVK